MQLVITLDLSDVQTFIMGGSLNKAQVANYLHFIGEQVEERGVLNGELRAMKVQETPRTATGKLLGEFQIVSSPN